MARWIRVLFLAAALGLVVHACRHDEPRGTGEKAYSVQLHLHGSFSEGLGSIDSHSYEARDVGCDVLWWSDHDFRITTFEHASRFGFEGFEERLERGEPWVSNLKRYQGSKKQIRPLVMEHLGRWQFTPAPVREGERSLRVVTAHAGPEFEPELASFEGDRLLHRRSLATGITLRLALFPETLGQDARARVEVQVSEHAPREGLGLVPYVVRYEIAPDAAARRPEREGEVYVVPVACELGRWNELELALSADAVRGFPLFPGEDDSLHELTLGVQSRNGAQAAACFDDLRIDQERTGTVVQERQGELIQEVAALYPELEELQGLEVSYGARHLNLFCVDTPSVDYSALEALVPRETAADDKAFQTEVIRRVVAEAHARGGLVSYNHPFGVGYEESEKRRPNEQLLQVLLRNRAEGADILEVGYRDRGGATLADHLWLWDQAALHGLRLVGTGVSDSHGGPENRWRGQPNNFVSWIYAALPDKAHLKEKLIDGLRRGRVFFGDLERFDGELDLVTDAGARMGETVVSDASEVGVELQARGLKGGERIVLVESGARTRELPVSGTEFRERVVVRLPAPGPAFVRFEVHDASGAIALSNPIHFLRKEQGR